MTSIVIAAAEQSIAHDLRPRWSEMEAVEAVFVVESTSDLVSTVLRLDPDVVLVHDQLGPEPALQAVRDLSLRRPDLRRARRHARTDRRALRRRHGRRRPRHGRATRSRSRSCRPAS